VSIFFSRISIPLRSTPFPYTTLFRSDVAATVDVDDVFVDSGRGDKAVELRLKRVDELAGRVHAHAALVALSAQAQRLLAIGQIRSEEHTSELQSLAYLVCRLLLEKKK